MHSAYVSQLLAVTVGLRSTSLKSTSASRPTAHATSHSGAIATPCVAAKRLAALRAVSFAKQRTASGPSAAPSAATRFTTISRNGAAVFGNACGGVRVATTGLGRQRSGPRPPKKSATWAQRPSKERCGAAASAAARRAARSSGARGASRSRLITSPSSSTRTTSTGNAYGSQGSSSYT